MIAFALSCIEDCMGSGFSEETLCMADRYASSMSEIPGINTE